MNQNLERARKYFTLSDNFFHLVQAVLTETVKSGNQQFLITRPIENYEQRYKELTNWSDFRIVIPTLFSFFHGIELELKALNYLVKPPKKVNHDLCALHKEFNGNYPDKTVLNDVFAKYIYPSKENCKVLYDFYSLNDFKDSSQFYEVFKYPYKIDLKTEFDYSALKSIQKRPLGFFKEIIADIDTIQTERNKI